LPVSQSISALLWLRLQDAWVLLGLAVIGWPGWSWEWRVALALLVVAVMAILPRALARIQARIPNGSSTWHAWREALLGAHRHAAVIWMLTGLNWVIKLGMQALLLVWLFPAPWTTGWLGSVGAEWAVFLPLQGWAGVGTYEAGAALAMSFQGVDWASGLQFALVMHTWVLLNATLAGLLAGLVTVRHSMRS